MGPKSLVEPHVLDCTTMPPKYEPDDVAMARADECLFALEDECCRDFLSSFHLNALDDLSWSTEHFGRVARGTSPRLEVCPVKHEEASGHTWYRFDCVLTMRGEAISTWAVWRRLKHIRDGLHDPLKQSFGNERYTDMMGDAHFPSG